MKLQNKWLMFYVSWFMTHDNSTIVSSALCIFVYVCWIYLFMAIEETRIILPVWPLFLIIVWFGSKSNPSNINGFKLICFTFNESISIGLWYLPKHVLYCSPQWLGPVFLFLRKEECSLYLLWANSKIGTFRTFIAEILTPNPRCSWNQKKKNKKQSFNL